MRQAVALATLTGTAASDDADHLLSQLTEFEGRPPWQRQRVDDWLTGLYPAEPGEPHPNRWGPLEPDMLGEYLVLTTLSLHAVSTALDPGRDWDLLERVLTVLSRVASDAAFAEKIAPAVNKLLPDLAAAALEEANDRERYVDGKVLIPTALAALCETLGTRLDAATTGDAEAELPVGHPLVSTLALALATITVAGFRSSAEADYSTYAPYLANALSNFSARLAIEGRGAEAESVANEGVELWTNLMAVRPVEYSHYLATALMNLANVLSGLERPRDAVVVAEKAIRECRKMLNTNRVEGASVLAGCLTSYSNHLSDAERLYDAVAPAQEAVVIFTGLAQVNSSEYTPHLARAITNYSNRLSAVRQHAEALVTAESAVRVYQDLAGENPGAYTPALAGMLNNYGLRLMEADRWLEAVKPAEEAVRLYKALARANRGAHTIEGIKALRNCARLMSKLGKHDIAARIQAEIDGTQLH